jgi:hypothetical protein
MDKNSVKEAKTLLQRYGLKSIKPIQLVQASKQLHKSLLETLEIIAFLKSGGQGYGPFPYTERALKGKHA